MMINASKAKKYVPLQSRGGDVSYRTGGNEWSAFGPIPKSPVKEVLKPKAASESAIETSEAPPTLTKSASAPL